MVIHPGEVGREGDAESLVCLVQDNRLIVKLV